MKAAVFYGPGDLRIESVPTPRPGPGEVLVAVHDTGICAGDISIYKGRNPYVTYPEIGGHEIAGVVDSVGEGVLSTAPAERVVIEPFLSCGACYPCRIGKSNCCANLRIVGAHRPGGFAEYVCVPAQNVHRIPDELPMEMASFAEPVAIAVQASRRAGIAEGELVLVLGCGPIGLAVTEVARELGAHVVGVDLVQSRLEAALRLGAQRIINAAEEDVLQSVLELTGGEGAPVVVEASGNPRVIESTVELVAAGGRVCVLGLVPKGVPVTLPGLSLITKEMTIVGSRASVNCFPEAISLLAQGKITYPQWAVRRSMWEADKVFAELDQGAGDVVKVVLTTRA